jgi:hypothetical protein
MIRDLSQAEGVVDIDFRRLAHRPKKLAMLIDKVHGELNKTYS